MTDPLLPCVELEPEAEARHAVIWLHGLGADGHDFEPVAPLLGLDDLDVRFVFPHAPVRPVTLNMGMAMRAWYDIKMLERRRHYEDDEILASAAAVEALVRRENERGIPTSRIVLAGFSQGGAIAVHAGLLLAERPAGLVALSTYLVREDALDDETGPHAAGLPVLVCHGRNDPMVPFSWGEALRDRLESLGCDVAFRAWPMQHEVVMEEIQVVGAFIREALGSGED